jgi:uncharacterized protein
MPFETGRKVESGRLACPRVEAPPVLRPHPRLRTVWFLRGAGLGLLLAPFLGWPLLFPLAYTLRRAGVDLAWSFAWAGVLLFAAFLLGLYLWTRAAHAHLRYEFAPGEVRIHRGWFIRAVTRIPHARIRTVVVRDGPLLKRFGLATVRIDVDRGASGMDTSRTNLVGLPRADEVARALLARLRAPIVPTATVRPAPPVGPGPGGASRRA